ncbi:MAG: bifunctional phosphoribosylaminoimidazolecarboxamide formyltransferase/IMP cyclohydrolase [Sphingobacteriales bacterium 17-39-43]|uniref:bifunctional phosphoribosylaminoimidazolecarboxamide formyltransferase/IMP cyclohydrolase n=1 Tax=Daejeonella sp. TaxID=2805397 RepID=UPI000BC3EFF7|nr:bifunctional phosphoribosylaminoimidazolecarboxamide formyltransferase/IMP cyclohydrolase [Daejeonella sp.]OYZ30631.1 MAG: bifunctional phosphoribosylaminoimidazolecarboxamide formyltransferase/IMP cyclohydrolase [Sphingobacteriales bacterium 16-39-50]OZA23352.1 MAG: bifunctional phosphoribosylaminoimidazolecarboxamide formyltransferase/IMP cyclohydrolase [Sphingobacteriales bacterium 17-39-43]HQS51610.1 bifunctional phosphoribosylaminoimidazolecarboxamide formyltransferase/IMP cyclohydrolase
MSHPVKIKNALISVYYKDNLEPLIRQLHEQGVIFYSTGGTEKFIRELGIDVIAVEDLTGYPSILGGRVKTLHPKVFGGILNRRENKEDKAQIGQYEIPEIDLVIVDLYPFEETLRSGASDADIIEKIDIGGISLIRAAAKNFNDVVIIASKDDYKTLGDILTENGGYTTLSHRKAFARQAFNVSSHYDTAIFSYFNQEDPLTVFKYSEQKASTLRYGENPHQNGVFYGDLDAMFDKLNGKELSYNNLVDVDAAVALIDEFEEPTFAILKHTNACGIASNESIVEAWKAALACDPVSAFGGVLICNREIDSETAAEINNLFFEVLIAPSFAEPAKQILTTKKNRILLKRNDVKLPSKQFKTLLNGVIEQDKDMLMETATEMKPVTERKPTEQQVKDLVFANKIVKHTKSNTIVLARNSCLIASGVGQTSRVDALQQAIVKAKAFNFDLEGSVMASDAFFPFPDCVEIAADAGVVMILQPGGSIKDQESIDMANAKGVGMVTTGIRHFKH